MRPRARSSRISRLTTRGEHGPANEDVGERHATVPCYCFGRSSGRVSGWVLSMRMAAPGLSLSWPVVTTSSPAAIPDAIGDTVVARLARLHEAPVGDQLGLALPCRRALLLPGRGARFLHDVEAVAIEAVGDGRARHGDDLARLAGEHHDVGEHARQQLAHRVGQAAAHEQRACVLSDARIERFDRTLEHVARERIDGDLDAAGQRAACR